MKAWMTFRAGVGVGLVAGLVSIAACGPTSLQVERSVARRVLAGGTAKSVEARSVLRRDMWRDMATRVKRLPAPRTVFRYMSRAEAQTVGTRGITPGKHFTSNGGPGRPLGAARAAERYGLPVVPSHRVTVRLPAGTPVKTNKVIGGGRGVGELRVVGPVPEVLARGPVRLSR